MQVLNKKEVEKDVGLLKSGVYVYPTDTIYGIGCDATDRELVGRVREIKNRDSNPFSVIAPGKDWILENCVVSSLGKKWLDKLPGPYTFIFKLKNLKCVAANVCKGDKLGVRIPKHWISEVVERLGRPIVTTSANISGLKNMESLDDLDDKIVEEVDFVIYEGDKKGKASEVWDLSGEKERRLR